MITPAERSTPLTLDAMAEIDDASTVTLHEATAEEAHHWHDGVGWYYVIDEYPDEGSCGAFASEEAACRHAVECGYQIGSRRG